MAVVLAAHSLVGAAPTQSGSKDRDRTTLQAEDDVGIVQDNAKEAKHARAFA